MRILAGTSGYAYKEWKGVFYPADLKASDMLRYYAGRFKTVEINNTFYRMPTEKLLLGWRERVPEDFSMVLKASRSISHRKDLAAAEDRLQYLFDTASLLGDRLGPMLFQFPPYLKKDVEKLQGFLERFPADRRAAFEFRHDSWFDEEVYDRLRTHNIALVLADKDGSEAARPVATADYGYMRLRRAEYGRDTLRQWLDRIVAQPWTEAHVFFKHEDDGAGPRLASELMELVAGA